MPEEVIYQAVIESLREIQQISGRPEVVISPETCPLTDLPEFDSPNGVEATVAIDGRLGGILPEELVSLFVDESRQPRTVRGVCDAIAALSNGGRPR